VRVALAALIVMLLAGEAEAQYALDAKGRRYQCLPGDRSCTLLPQPAPLQPLPERGRTVDAPRQRPPPYVPCGSRCDLLDRMK
jgi:hypothetical protein